MALTKPTIQELTERIQADMVSRLSVNAVLRRSIIRVIARCFAGAVYLLYGLVFELSRQRFTKYATGSYLDDDGEEWGVVRKSATFASGPVTFTGDNGAVVPAGWIVANADRDQFAVDADITITGGIGTGTVTALEPGSNSNTPEGSAIELVSPIAGVESDAVVASGGITGGTDLESDDSLRDRILSKKRQQGLGGNENDWIVWTKNYQGLQITRVWVFPQYAGARTVGIFFTLDTLPVIIPTQTDIDAVKAYLDSFRPVGCIPVVYAPVPATVTFSIALNPNSTTVRDAVTAALQELFLRAAAVGGTIPISHVREAISTAAGELDNAITSVTISGVSGDPRDITVAPGYLPVLGQTTFTTKA